MVELDTKRQPMALISYRRADSQSLTERIAERLEEIFGKDSVFIDTDDIPIGTRFDEHIESSLERCSVVLAMIGREWLSSRPPSQEPRLFEPQDFVRRELEWSSEQGIPVVPVLLDGAKMPAKKELPESIQYLTDLNAVHLRPGSDFLFTTYRLATYLQDEHGFPRPAERFRWEYVICPIAIISTIVGVGNSVMLTLGVLSPIFAQGRSLDVSGWLSGMLVMELLGPLLLGAGPLGIVFAKRLCCLRQLQARRPSHLGILDVEKTKEPNAMLGFAFGLSAIGWGVLSGVPAIYLSAKGLIGIRKKPSVFFGSQYGYLGILFALLGSLISFQVQSAALFLFQGYRSLEHATKLVEAGEYAEAEPLVLDACDRLPYLTSPYLLAARVFSAEAKYEDAFEAASIVIDDLEQRREMASNSVNASAQLSVERQRETLALMDAYWMRAVALRSSGDDEAAKVDEERAKILEEENKQDRRAGRLRGRD